MSIVCPECGADVPDGETCRSNFDALLLLEWQVPGGPGAGAHFLAVSSYVLQHPKTMGYTTEALDGARESVVDYLAGRTTLDGIRGRVRRAVDGPKRITRRPGEPVPRWSVTAWPVSVADVLAGGVVGYADRVRQWAESITQTLDAANA